MIPRGARERLRQLADPAPVTGRARIERYTEADIARLKDEDLSDLTVMGKLREAYRQNDPNEEQSFPGLRHDPDHSLIGTVESFERRTAEAEEELQSNPTDYMARAKCLYAMAGRGMMHRRDELRARHPELCDGRWHMPKRTRLERPGNTQSLGGARDPGETDQTEGRNERTTASCHEPPRRSTREAGPRQVT